MSGDGGQGVESEVLRRVTPTLEQERDLAATAARLEGAGDAALAAAGIPGQARVQGSVAKGTWLAGGADIDLFLLLDPAVPPERLEQVALEVGPRLLRDCQKRYAQHPYLTGRFEGRSVDLVPAYRVAAPTARMSAVDRTPFHTAWVRQRLDEGGRGQVRLLKQWLKGVGAYGAQTEVGGLSGYLVEVLVARFGGFREVLQWLEGGSQPRRIALGPDLVKDEVSPLVVVDPVDPARNCAAAVQADTLGRAEAAARAYQAAPNILFFFPAPPRPEPADALRAALRRRGEHWVGVRLRPRTDRLDVVFPQFQKAMRTVAGGLEAAGFPLRRCQALHRDGGRDVLLQWVTEAVVHPAEKVHRGPRDDGAGGAHAQRFRAKWEGHPDAVGPVRTAPDGRVEVTLRDRRRTAGEHLRSSLRAIPLGRHVEDAMADAQVWTDVAEADAAWAAEVADTVLDRRPWER